LLPGRALADSLDCGEITLTAEIGSTQERTGLPSRMHGAGAALADAATELCAGETEMIAQDP
jgi:hypothetical protein